MPIHGLRDIRRKREVEWGRGDVCVTQRPRFAEWGAMSTQDPQGVKDLADLSVFDYESLVSQSNAANPRSGERGEKVSSSSSANADFRASDSMLSHGETRENSPFSALRWEKENEESENRS